MYGTGNHFHYQRGKRSRVRELTNQTSNDRVHSTEICIRPPEHKSLPGPRQPNLWKSMIHRNLIGLYKQTCSGRSTAKQLNC